MQEKIIIIKIYKQKKRGKAIEHKEMDKHETLVASIRWNLLMEKPTRFCNFWAHLLITFIFSTCMTCCLYASFDVNSSESLEKWKECKINITGRNSLGASNMRDHTMTCSLNLHVTY